MPTEIQITWDGVVPGLAEHRLSIGAYGESLKLLLVALRRIANEMVSNAMEGEGSQKGRLVTAAKNIDIEITGIKQNSSGFNGLVTFHSPPQQIPFMSLEETSAVALLEDIDRETKGYPVNGAVRTYLRSLPPGTTRQVYEIYDGALSKKRVEVGEVKLVELAPDLPVLRTFEGNVVGVGFEPGKVKSRLNTGDSFVSTTASPTEVDKAISLRKEDVRTIAIQDSKRTRLISLRRAADARPKIDRETAKKYIYDRWNNVLKQLAK